MGGCAADMLDGVALSKVHVIIRVGIRFRAAERVASFWVWDREQQTALVALGEVTSAKRGALEASLLDSVQQCQ